MLEGAGGVVPDAEVVLGSTSDSVEVNCVPLAVSKGVTVVVWFDTEAVDDCWEIDGVTEMTIFGEPLSLSVAAKLLLDCVVWVAGAELEMVGSITGITVRISESLVEDTCVGSRREDGRTEVVPQRHESAC